MKLLTACLLVMIALTSIASAHSRAASVAQATRMDNHAESVMWGMPIEDAVCAAGARGNFGCDYSVCVTITVDGVGVSGLGRVLLEGHDAVMRDGRVLAGQQMRIVAAC